MSDVQDIKQAIGELNGPPGAHRVADSVFKPALARVASYWWIALLLGVFWILVGVVVLT